MSDKHPTDMLEPMALSSTNLIQPMGHVLTDQRIMLSIAISLKRLADSSDKLTTESVNEWGEPFHAAIAGSVARALREFGR